MSVSAKRNAKIELTVSTAGMDGGLNEGRRKMRGFQREQDKIAKQAARDEKKRAESRQRYAKSTLGMGQSIAGGMAAAAGFDVAGGIGGIAHEIGDFQKELTRFQIDAQLSAAEVARFNDQVTETSNASGQSRIEILKGAHAYQILTGDAKGAIEASKLFAEVANASGASMEDIATAGAALNKNLGIDPKNLREGFDIILSMGHKGSVELRDVASELAGIAPQFAQFGGGGGAKGLSELMASLQVVRHGFGSASEAATGLQSLMTGIIKKRGKLEAAGIKVVDPKTGKLRDFMQIMDEMKAKKFDLMSLMDELGRIEGVKAATQLVGKANAEMHDLYSTALDSNQVAKDNATYMESSSGRIAKAWEQIKNTIGDALSPERVEAFASLLEKAGSVWKSIYNFGRSARGALSGPVVKLSAADQAVLAAADKEQNLGIKDRSMAAMTRGDDVGDLNDDEKWKTIVEGARRRAASVESSNAAISNIMDAETDEKTTPESIKRAVIASTSMDPQTALMGNKYLDKAGVDEQQRADIMAKAMSKALGPMVAQLREIVANTGSPPPVKIGAEPIQKAVSNNVLHRTRPGGR